MADGTPVAVQVETLIQQGEPNAALKLVESARREALSCEDIASLHEVLAAARLVHGHGDQKQRNEAVRIANAAQKNICFLGRKAALAAGEVWVDPFRPARPPDAGQQPREPRFLFEDAARPRTLALAVIAGIVAFPVIWFAMVMMSAGDISGGGGEHVFVSIAGVIASLGIVVATGAWVIARRKVPVTEREPLAGIEGMLGAAGVLAVAAGGAVLGYVLWILPA